MIKEPNKVPLISEAYEQLIFSFLVAGVWGFHCFKPGSEVGFVGIEALDYYPKGSSLRPMCSALDANLRQKITLKLVLADGGT